MARTLNIHLASFEERIQLYRNIYKLWPMAPSLEEHLQIRLNRPKDNRAVWYTGCLDGKVVAGLGCHPMQYYFNGQEVNGCSIGSVHTLPEYRRRGFAAKVMDYVEKDQKKKGARLSSLYSDITPQYYEKLGYLQCPGWETWAEAGGSTQTQTNSSVRTLLRFSPSSALKELNRCYRDYHRFLPLAVARPQAYWEFTLAKQPNDEFYWLKSATNHNQGYIRLTEINGSLRVSDFAVSQETSEALQILFGLVINLTHKKGLAGVGGWLPNEPAIRLLFDIKTRTQAITMVKSLDPKLKMTDKHLRMADRFCQIDHV